MRRWKDNILTKMDLREIRRRGRGMDSSNPGQGQVSGSCEHGNEPSGLITCRVFSDNGEPYKGCAAGLRVFSGSLSFHRDHISERPWYRWAALREAPWRIAEPVVTVRQHIQISFNQAFQTVLLFLSKQTFTLSELLYIFTPAISQAFGNNWGSKRTLGQTEVESLFTNVWRCNKANSEHSKATRVWHTVPHRYQQYYHGNQRDSVTCRIKGMFYNKLI